MMVVLQRETKFKVDNEPEVDLQPKGSWRERSQVVDEVVIWIIFLPIESVLKETLFRPQRTFTFSFCVVVVVVVVVVGGGGGGGGGGVPALVLIDFFLLILVFERERTRMKAKGR